MPAAPNSPTRRELEFHEYEDIAAEAQRLRDGGYSAVGKWNLAQTCEHLADWMSFPIDGFPKLNPITRFAFGVMRVTFGKRMGKRLIATKKMAAGNPTLSQTVPPPDIDLDAAVQRLSETAARCRTFRGPFHASPIFGKLDAEQWKQLHLVHAAHHFSFLLPERDEQAS